MSSQTYTDGEAESTANTDSDTDSDSVADTLESELSFATELLASLEDSDIESMSDEELVKVRSACKALEDISEETRKDLDSEVKNRVNPGESLLGLSHIESHNKYVSEDAGTIIMRAVSEGIDYTEFISINASQLSDMAPDLCEVHRSEYSYVR